MTDPKIPDQDNGVMDHDEQMILSLLKAIEDEPNTTQKDLATRLGVAVGMVNSYLKRVIYKGYVKTKQLERRRLRYLVTPSGIKEKTRLTYEFLQYSYQYINDVRNKVGAMMDPFVKNGKKQVIFYGSGEVAELAYLALRERGMNLVAVIDPNRVGMRCVDHEIKDTGWLTKNGNADILLTLGSSKNRELDNELKLIANKRNMEYVSYP